MMVKDKYGRPLTGTDWAGLPVRLGEFGAQGAIADLHGESDAVLVWTGAENEVNIRGSKLDSLNARESRSAFVRRSGMVDLLPSGTSIREIEWGGGAMECVSVSFAPDVVRSLMGQAAPSLDIGGPRYGLVDAHVVDLVKRLQAQVQTGCPLGPAYVQGLSLTLVSYVAQRYSPHTLRSGEPSRLDAAQLDYLQRYIDEHLAAPIGLLDLASLVGYSPDHFSRLFKRAFGTTPHRYLTCRRLEKAKSMLRDPRRSIASIAIDCGFSSQTHLTVAFKKATGVTPGVYRRD